MTIPKKILEKWDSLYYKGDADKIAKESGCHVNTVYNALREGKCSPDTFQAIANFYAEREDLINQYE